MGRAVETTAFNQCRVSVHIIDVPLWILEWIRLTASCDRGKEILVLLILGSRRYDTE